MEYPSSLETLFRLCVGVKNAQMDDIIAELEMRHSDGDDDHEYLKSLFLALQSSFKASSGQIGVNKSKDKLRALRSVSFVPLAKTSDSETMLRGGTFAETSSTPDWFIFDSSRLQDVFREVAWLLSFSTSHWKHRRSCDPSSRLWRKSSARNDRVSRLWSKSNHSASVK